MLLISEGRSRSVRVGFVGALPCHHDGPQWPHSRIDLLKNTAERGCRWDPDSDFGNPARDPLGIEVRLETLQHTVTNELIKRHIDRAAESGFAGHCCPFCCKTR